MGKKKADKASQPYGPEDRELVERAQALADEIRPQPDLFDMDYRPETYWDDPLEVVLGRIRIEHHRQALRRAVEEDGPEALNNEWLVAGPDPETQAELMSIHPSFMGGAFLPDMLQNEVEIARCSMDSVTNDQVCLWARPVPGGIAYRYVDEYMDTADVESEEYKSRFTFSKLPLTFREVVAIFDEVFTSPRLSGDYDGWGFHTGFYTFSSSFYPDIDDYFIKWMKENGFGTSVILREIEGLAQQTTSAAAAAEIKAILKEVSDGVWY